MQEKSVLSKSTRQNYLYRHGEFSFKLEELPALSVIMFVLNRLEPYEIINVRVLIHGSGVDTFDKRHGLQSANPGRNQVCWPAVFHAISQILCARCVQFYLNYQSKVTRTNLS